MEWIRRTWTLYAKMTEKVQPTHKQKTEFVKNPKLQTAFLMSLQFIINFKQCLWIWKRDSIDQQETCHVPSSSNDVVGDSHSFIHHLRTVLSLGNESSLIISETFNAYRVPIDRSVEDIWFEFSSWNLLMHDVHSGILEDTRLDLTLHIEYFGVEISLW